MTTRLGSRGAWVVWSEAEMLALPAGVGDACIRHDSNPDKVYTLTALPANVSGNWVAAEGGGGGEHPDLAAHDTLGLATQTELNNHEADTTSVHGIADTSTLYRSGGTDVAVADGGTGASTAADARTNLGLGDAATKNTGTTAGTVAAGDDSRFTTVTANRQTASYTLALSDAGKVVEMDVATANNLTVPANATVAFPVGTVLTVWQYGAGQTTIVAGGGVTLRAPDGLVLGEQYAAASLRKVATDEWEVQAAAAPEGITVQDEGTPLSTGATTLNFTGAGVTASGTGATKTINIPGGGTGVTVQEEGTPLTTVADTLNFVGAAVTAAGTTGTKTITVTALVPSNNLSDVASAATSRTNLGLGDAATKNTGTAAGTVAAGDDSRFTTITANRQTANYTLVLGDAAKAIEMEVATANTLTVPPNSSVAFPVGTVIEFVQWGAGQTTITPGAGVTIRASGAKLKTAAQYAQGALRKVATDEWIAAGDLAA